MSRRVTYPPDPIAAARALRLDAAMKAVGLDFSELGARIGLKTSAAVSIWRQGASPQVDRWEQAAKALGVTHDWLMAGVGKPPPRVATCYAWLLSDPDLPPHISRGERRISFSRNRQIATALDTAEADLGDAGQCAPPSSSVASATSNAIWRG